MSMTEARQQRSISGKAVDEEYKKLQRFHIDHRIIVLVDDEDPPEGGFGIVRRAELHQAAYLPAWLASRRYGPPQLVAVKQIKLTKVSNTPRMKRAFTREVLVWSSLEAHPGLAKFLGFYANFENSKAWLLSPWEPNGNVSEFIKTHNLEVPEKLSLVYDTIDALNFLHQLNPPVCHGDIKSANVLVSAEYRARLCDFGLARLHEDSGFGRLESSTGMKWSLRWCSPEVLNGAPREPTSDVYSWAWLVWEIMTGKLPYEETTVDFVIMRQIFESPLPQVDGQSRLSDCLQDVQDDNYVSTSLHSRPCESAPLLENLGDLESWKGNQEKSTAYLNEALRLYCEEADAKGIASVLRKQTVATYRISDYIKLRAIATTALEHCRRLNDALGIAEASFYLGFSVDMLGNPDEALPMLRESLDIRRTHGDDVGAVQCLERIGEIQRHNGQPLEALSTLNEAVALASRSGDRLGLALALHVVGNTHSYLSDFVKATDALSDAATIARNIGWEGGLGVILNSMGSLKMRLGDYGAAQGLFQESIPIARRIGDRYTLARGLEGLGDCFQGQFTPKEAVPLLEEACLLWQELSQPWGSRRVASTLVELKSRQGDWDRTLFWLDHIIAVCRIQKQQQDVADYLERKGQILANAQRYDEAALHFEAAMLLRWENGYLWHWQRVQLRRQLCAIPKTTMKWERWSPLLCDLKKLQRRQPQLVTTSLKLPILIGYAEL